MSDLDILRLKFRTMLPGFDGDLAAVASNEDEDDDVASLLWGDGMIESTKAMTHCKHTQPNTLDKKSAIRRAESPPPGY